MDHIVFTNIIRLAMRVLYKNIKLIFSRLTDFKFVKGSNMSTFGVQRLPKIVKKDKS